MRQILNEAGEELSKNGKYSLELRDDHLRKAIQIQTYAKKILENADDVHLWDEAYLLEAVANGKILHLRLGY